MTKAGNSWEDVRDAATAVVMLSQRVDDPRERLWYFPSTEYDLRSVDAPHGSRELDFKKWRRFSFGNPSITVSWKALTALKSVMGGRPRVADDVLQSLPRFRSTNFAYGLRSPMMFGGSIINESARHSAMALLTFLEFDERAPDLLLKELKPTAEWLVRAVLDKGGWAYEERGKRSAGPISTAASIAALCRLERFRVANRLPSSRLGKKLHQAIVVSVPSALTKDRVWNVAREGVGAERRVAEGAFVTSLLKHAQDHGGLAAIAPEAPDHIRRMQRRLLAGFGQDGWCETRGRGAEYSIPATVWALQALSGSTEKILFADEWWKIEAALAHLPIALAKPRYRQALRTWDWAALAELAASNAGRLTNGESQDLFRRLSQIRAARDSGTLNRAQIRALPPGSRDAVTYCLTGGNSRMLDRKVRGTAPVRPSSPDETLAGIEREVRSLLKRHGFVAAEYHLSNALERISARKWSEANGQTRNFFESLLNELSDRFNSPGRNQEGPSSAKEKSMTRWAVLAQIEPRFLDPDRGEFRGPGQPQSFIGGLWARLHSEGPHPGRSDKSDSTFRIRTVLMTANLLLKRFHRRVNPKMSKNTGMLVLFDLDETLIDRSYQLNIDSEQLLAAFGKAVDRSAVIGLNSDTPLRSLWLKHKLWGMNGPIVAERGAQLLTAQGEILDLAPAAADFPKLRDRFVHELSRLGDMCVRFATAWDLEEVVLKAPLEAPLVIFNPYRERSLSFWVRRGGRVSAAEFDVPLLESVAADLDALMRAEFHDLWKSRDSDINRDYCICVMHLRETQKTTAVKLLLDTWPRAFMVGNSDSDRIDDPRVIHGAVGNAHASFLAHVRKQGGLIAKQDLTAGSVELLDSILRAGTAPSA